MNCDPIRTYAFKITHSVYKTKLTETLGIQILKYTNHSIQEEPSVVPGHQIEEIVDVHLVGLVGLSELLEVHVLLAVLEDLTKCEVLDEEVVEAVFLRQLQLLIDVFGESPQDALEVLDGHQLVFIVDDEELVGSGEGLT